MSKLINILITQQKPDIKKLDKNIDDIMNTLHVHYVI